MVLWAYSSVVEPPAHNRLVAGSSPAGSTKLHIAGWSSLVARRAHNPKVVGSNPSPATKMVW